MRAYPSFSISCNCRPVSVGTTSLARSLDAAMGGQEILKCVEVDGNCRRRLPFAPGNADRIIARLKGCSPKTKPLALRPTWTIMGPNGPSEGGAATSKTTQALSRVRFFSSSAKAWALSRESQTYNQRLPVPGSGRARQFPKVDPLLPQQTGVSLELSVLAEAIVAADRERHRSTSCNIRPSGIVTSKRLNRRTPWGHGSKSSAMGTREPRNARKPRKGEHSPDRRRVAGVSRASPCESSRQCSRIADDATMKR